METSPPRKKSPAYKALLKAGPNLKALQQVHAHIIISGSHRSRSLLTKLITLACEAGSILYTHKLYLTVPCPDSFLFNSLLKSSAKFGFPNYTLFLYRSLLRFRIPPSSYTFTSIIKACADLASLRLGEAVHSHVVLCGFASERFVQAALVSLYAKCGEFRVARKMFDEMPERSVVGWNSIISGYEQNGFSREAVEVFNEMRDSGVEADATGFVNMLAACSQLGDFGLGCWVHDEVVRTGMEVTVELGTALVNMYARCGSVSKARQVFDSMEVRNVITWTAMISGYGTNGYGRQAVELFGKMRAQGPSPNSVTFVAVLSACAHAGLVIEGKQVYANMREEYGLVSGVEHRVCMVDMLGRSGLLDEAFQFIEELSPAEAAPPLWTAMLGACKMHKNIDLGVRVAEYLLKIEPENPGHYVMLSNIYALAGRMDRVEMVRNMMKGRSLRKKVGYSTIDVNRKTYLFSMGDQSHEETNEIYQYLNELMLRCNEAGYAPVPELVMHEVEEEEREFSLRYHSEKLAIAYGLMKTTNGEAIRIVKNLRMCEDCHSAIKYISTVTKREIIVRDKLRFHHFKDGTCSCLDYW